MKLEDMLKQKKIIEKYKNISVESVHKLFRYENGYLFWKKPPYKYNIKNKGKPAGYITKGYRFVTINQVRYHNCFLTWLYHKEYVPESLTWKNGVTTDDRIENLIEKKDDYCILKKNTVYFLEKINKRLSLYTNKMSGKIKYKYIHFKVKGLTIAVFPGTIEGLKCAIQYKTDYLKKNPEVLTPRKPQRIKLHVPKDSPPKQEVTGNSLTLPVGRQHFFEA